MKTQLINYKFNLTNDSEREAYKALCSKLKSEGYKPLDVWADTGFHKGKKTEDGIIELDTSFLSNNQWNTTDKSETNPGLRVFDWYKTTYFHNRNIVEGHYLVITDEMKQIRKDFSKCGYCGHRYKTGTQEFCTECLGSEYLKPEDLFMLRLRTYDNENQKLKITEEEKDKLMALYIKAQTKLNEKKLADKIADISITWKTKLQRAENEYKGFMWLIDKKVNVDNVIYYDHIDTFGFGWREPYSEEVRTELEKVLKDFPYKWEFRKN